MPVRRRLLTVLLFVLAALTIAAASYLLAGLVNGRRGMKVSFNLQLKQIDEDLSLGYFERATEGIRKASSRAQSEQNHLRLLKRAYRVSTAEGDFSILRSVASRALEVLPGSRDLRFLLLFASMRAELAPSRITGLDRSMKESADAQYLVAEALARGWSWGQPGIIPNLDPQLRALLSMEKQPDPSGLQEQGVKRGDGRLVLDAALMWMQSGDAARAHAAVQGEWNVPVPLEPRVFIAFDAGRFEDCAALIDRLPGSDFRLDLQLLKADALRVLNREREAAELYRRVINGDARFAWSPYLNLARIAVRGGGASAAIPLYRRAFELFPETDPVGLEYGRSLLQTGQTDQAVQLLERLVMRDPQNVSARFILLQAAATNLQDQSYQAGIWNLFSEHPDSPLLCRVLAQQLLAGEDYRGAAAVLDRFKLPAGGLPPPWLLELKGLSEALRGDYDQAASMITESLQRRSSWRSSYNLAMVYRAAGILEKSVNELLQAADELRQEQNRGSLIAGQRHSRIRSMAAELLLRMGNKDAARRESAYALELDPANGQALLVLRMLEGK
jgi:tetratricopeptide (TPR) repeat protein